MRPDVEYPIPIRAMEPEFQRRVEAPPPTVRAQASITLTPEPTPLKPFIQDFELPYADISHLGMTLN